MVEARRRTVGRAAGLGAIAIAATVIAYVLFLGFVGAPWTEVPESPTGTPANGVLIPAPIGPVVIGFVTASLAAVGIAARLRGFRWGLYLAWIASFSLTTFGAIFIFGSFGLTFIGGVALLAFVAVFAWYGRGVPT